MYVLDIIGCRNNGRDLQEDIPNTFTVMEQPM